MTEITLEQLVGLPRLEDPQLAPDGTAVAYVHVVPDLVQDTEVRTVWRVAVEGGAGRPLTAGPEDRCPRWSPDGTTLAVLRGPAAGTRLVLLDDAGVARVVVADLCRPAEVAWSPDGRQVALTLVRAARDPHAPVVLDRLDGTADGRGALVGETRQLVVLDVATGAEVVATDLARDAATPAWSPDGSAVAFTTSAAPDPPYRPDRHVHLLDMGTGAIRQVGDAPGSMVAPAFTPDGATVVAVWQRDGASPGSLVALDLASGAQRILTADLDRTVLPGGGGYPGAPPLVLPGGTEVLLAARDGGGSGLFVTSLDGRAGTRPILGGPELVVRGATLAGRRLAAVVGSPASPGEVVVLDLDQRHRTTLTAATAEALPGADLAAPVLREFATADGTRLPGVLLGGGDDGPRPLLVDVHGGPHNAWTAALDPVNAHHQVLVARGWAVLLLNPRGSDGYGEAHFRGLDRAWGRADLPDVLGAVGALVAEGVADPDRLAITGYSYGGYMTCWAIGHDRRFRAAVAGGPVTDLTAFTGTSDMGVGMGADEFGWRHGEDAALLRELSPLTFADDVRTPLLLLHGEADLRCPPSQSELLFTALRTRGREAVLVRYPGGDHLFRLTGRPSHRLDYLRRLVAWVTEHTGVT